MDGYWAETASAFFEMLYHILICNGIALGAFRFKIALRKNYTPYGLTGEALPAFLQVIYPSMC